MGEVMTSSSGIIKNILSYNYSEKDVIKEYLNNVLPKNKKNSRYEVNLNFFEKGGEYIFDFTESAAVGFDSLPQLEKAYTIAESDRSGTNNMGFGIYSPITIHKDYLSVNLFIQDTDNGAYYSISFYNGDAANPKITTHQGNLEDLEFAAEFVTLSNGTRSIWFSAPASKSTEIPTSIQGMVKFVVHKSSEITTHTPDKTDIKKSIGESYFDYLNQVGDHKLVINYNGNQIEGVDILAKPSSNLTPHKKEYELIGDPNSDFYIKESGSPEWHKLTKTRGISEAKSITEPVGQKALLTILWTDLVPESTETIDTSLRKIFVKVDGTYIFGEEYKASCNCLTRVVLEFECVNDNNFDNYIRPDANKSRSTLTDEFKHRLTSLIKNMTQSTHTKGHTKEAENAEKFRVWGEMCAKEAKTGFEECGRGKCELCQKDLTVFDFKIKKRRGLPHAIWCGTCKQKQ